MESSKVVRNIPQIPVVDAHYDLGMFLQQERQKGKRKIIETELMPELRRGGVQVLVSAIYVDENSVSGSALRQACNQIAALQAEMKESPDLFSVCTSAMEIEKARKEGKPAIIMSFEGIEPLGRNVELLDFFYESGVRGIGLAHARRNLACDGAMYTSSPHNIGAGLTDFGVELVEKAQELHMLIDVSHLNDAGTKDVLDIVKGPVIASHSNCRALNPTLRNIDDTLLRRIADSGGVIGLNGCSVLVSDREGNASMEMLIEHLNHLVNVAGIEHVGLGFDIAQMILPDAYITVNGIKQKVVDIVASHGDIPEFTEELLKHGYTEEMLRKIYAENFLRVYRDVRV